MIALMNAFTDDNMSMMSCAWKCVEFLKVNIATEYQPLIDQADQGREQRTTWAILYGNQFNFSVVFDSSRKSE